MIKLSGGAEEGRSLCSPVVKGESSKRGVGFGEPWVRFSFCSQRGRGGHTVGSTSHTRRTPRTTKQTRKCDLGSGNRIRSASCPNCLHPIIVFILCNSQQMYNYCSFLQNISVQGRAIWGGIWDGLLRKGTKHLGKSFFPGAGIVMGSRGAEPRAAPPPGQAQAGEQPQLAPHCKQG